MAKLTEKSVDALFVKLKGNSADFKGLTARAGVFGGNYPSGTPIAYVAAIQEYGAPAANIPPRPFMRPTVKEQKHAWTQSMQAGVKAVVRGKIEATDVMEQVGALMAADIKQTISEITEPPLSPITVMLRGMRRNDASLIVTGKTVGEAAERVQAGETNYGAPTKPLVDEGFLIASITHAVKRET